MQTVILEINDTEALKAIQNLVQKRSVRIIDSTDIDSPALPGQPLSMKAFREWIHEAEKSPLISLAQAKEVWQRKKKQLLK